MLSLLFIESLLGLRQFRCDIELMINERPNWYWRICWLVITPTICLLLIISVLTNRIELKEKNYSFPPWAYVLYQSLSAGTVLLIVGWFIYKYCSEGGFLVSDLLIRTYCLNSLSLLQLEQHLENSILFNYFILK